MLDIFCLMDIWDMENLRQPNWNFKTIVLSFQSCSDILHTSSSVTWNAQRHSLCSKNNDYRCGTEDCKRNCIKSIIRRRGEAVVSLSLACQNWYRILRTDVSSETYYIHTTWWAQCKCIEKQKEKAMVRAMKVYVQKGVIATIYMEERNGDSARRESSSSS